MISDHIKERFLRDPLPIRLGNLASDLARVASLADDSRNQKVVTSVLEEGKWFAEWAAPGAPLETQAALAEVQVLMALWQLRWMAGRPDPDMRQQAKEWSDRLLALAGLV